MSSDDDTNEITKGESDENITQPTITAVFRLLRIVQETQLSFRSRLDSFETSINSRFESLETSINSRFESLETSVNSRFEALDARLARDFAGIDARFVQLSDEFKTALLELSDKLSDRIDLIRLHADAEYESFLRRLRKLESKAS